MRTATRRPRALRGLASAVVATVIAAAAHTLAGGGAPPWWMVAAVILLALPVTVALAGRRLTLGGTVASVATAQALLHLAFTAAGSAPASRSVSPAAAHDHGMGTLTPSPSLLDASVAGHLHLTPGMLAAHTAAAVVTVVLLVHGERVLRAFGRGWRRLVAVIAPLRTPPMAAASTPSWSSPSLIASFLSVQSRRGPPALAS